MDFDFPGPDDPRRAAVRDWLAANPSPTGRQLAEAGYVAGYLFSQALTIGGGTGDVQRNILAERVLGLPHDLDVEAGRTWADARRG